MRVHGTREVGRYCPMGRKKSESTGRWMTTRGVSLHMRLNLGPSRGLQHVIEGLKESCMVMVANVRQTSLSPIVLEIG
eukprot:scaffold541_cov335-Pavlova_lutheri.AAC.1